MQGTGTPALSLQTMSRWRQFPWTLAGLVLALAWLLLALGPMRHHIYEPLLSSLGRMPLLVLATWLALRRAQASEGRTRASLVLIAAALVSISIGDLLWSLQYLHSLGRPALGVWDAFYLGYFPLILGGLLLLPRAFASRMDLGKFVLDASIVVVAGGMFVWQFGLAPIITSAAPLGGLDTLIDVAYPVGDLLTLVGVATVLLRLPEGQARRSYALLGLALIASLGGDLTWALFDPRLQPWSDLLARGFWFSQALLFLAAAESTLRGGAPVRARALPRASLAALPYVALCLGYGLVAWVALSGRADALRMLLAWASVMTVAVVLRQAVSSRENALLLRERERLAGESRLAKLIENAADGILVLGRGMQILYASSPAQRMLGAVSRNLVGTSVHDVLLQDDAESLAQKLGQLDRASALRSGKLMLRFRNAASIVLTETTVTDQRDDPDLAGIVLNIRDVTAHQALEDQLRHDALHDPLTQLQGRELFLDRMTTALMSIGRGIDEVAVAVIEIDQWRLINDSLGHDRGDQLLLMCAARLQSQQREGESLARLNDTGFALLLGAQGDAGYLAALVERLRGAFNEGFMLDGNRLRVSCSLGLAVTGDAALPAAELLRRADTALNTAGRDGGGGYSLFAPEHHARVMERLRLQAQIPEAIEQGRFILHLQPVVGLVDGYPIALRPRVNWRDPRTAAFPIERLREAARRHETGARLGEWILDQAQREFANVIRYQSGAGHLSLLIAVSTPHLRDAGLIDRVQQLLHRLGLAAVNLHLSITEDSLADESGAALEALRRMRAIGVRLALAEFGGRASSLASLHEHLFDTLVLSSQLVRTLTPSSRATSLVRGVLALGEGLGTRVIAAGVDTAEQREVLAELGCLYGTGNALAPAMPVEQLLPWLGGRLAEAL